MQATAADHCPFGISAGRSRRTTEPLNASTGTAVGVCRTNGEVGHACIAITERAVRATRCSARGCVRAARPIDASVRLVAAGFRCVSRGADVLDVTARCCVFEASGQKRILADALATNLAGGAGGAAVAAVVQVAGEIVPTEADPVATNMIFGTGIASGSAIAWVALKANRRVDTERTACLLVLITGAHSSDAFAGAIAAR